MEMLLCILLLLMIFGGTGSLSVSMNGTVFCDENSWHYRLKVLEFDYLQNDFLGETSHEVSGMDRSTFHIELGDVESDGIMDNHIELGYEMKSFCHQKRFRFRFFSSVVPASKKIFHEEVVFDLNTADYKVVSTCEEYSCLPR